MCCFRPELMMSALHAGLSRRLAQGRGGVYGVVWRAHVYCRKLETLLV